MSTRELEKMIFDTSFHFEEKAIQVFQYQFEHVDIYRDFCRHLGKFPSNVSQISDIPFLPVEMFKFHRIIADNLEPEKIFRSSGTTSQTQSRHFIASLKLYEESILNGFQTHYGTVKDYCILALLPSYLERDDASLVYMVNYLMNESSHPENDFYLNNLSALTEKLTLLIRQKQKVILIGVSFALLDLAEQFPMDLSNVIVIETGGMKGRREEMTRNQLHKILKEAFQIDWVHSEYGMTEMLSQAYFTKEENFQPATTLKLMAREINDPFSYVENGETGALDVIDLANLYSCSFIATQDVGKVHSTGKFQVLGRMDYSDLRGCNLMVVE